MRSREFCDQRLNYQFFPSMHVTRGTHLVNKCGTKKAMPCAGSVWAPTGAHETLGQRSEVGVLASTSDDGTEGGETTRILRAL